MHRCCVIMPAIHVIIPTRFVHLKNSTQLYTQIPAHLVERLRVVPPVTRNVFFEIPSENKTQAGSTTPVRAHQYIAEHQCCTAAAKLCRNRKQFAISCTRKLLIISH